LRDEALLTLFQIIADDNSLNYLQQWEDSRGGPDPAQTQMRLDHARSALQAVLSDLQHPSVPIPKDEMSGIDRDGEVNMENGLPDGSNAEIVTIPITVDDELSDIPAEMRETVAKEITAFRDRSTRRDLERLKREEELEALERARGLNGPRPSRLASPPLAAPSGPAGGANGIPVGPRERPLNAPSGPKAFGQQIPRDYQKGVSFVNGSGINGAAAGWIDREDEDSEASDEELERRRKAKKDAELEKQYLDQERRWLNRERSRTAAVEREKNRDQEDDGKADKEKDATAARLKAWNDDIESSHKAEEYYLDRSLWIRNRAAFRTREAALDEADRAAENRELARDYQQRERAGAMADDFLNRQADEMESKVPAREPQRFKLSLGAAAQKAQTATQPHRTAFEVEGLLEDEEEDDSKEKRTLIPIKFDSAAEAAGLTDEERAQAARQLAQDIPTDKDGLWRWQVKWDFVDEAVIAEQLKPFVEKKIMEYLGVQEQMLVDVVESHLRGRGGPQELVEQLEGVSLIFHFCVGLLLTMEFCRRWTKKPKCWSRSCGGWSSSFQNQRSEACHPRSSVHKSQPNECHTFQVIVVHQVHVLKCRIVHPTPIQMTLPAM
jgi:PWI domain